jgi:hypothetical protein
MNGLLRLYVVSLSSARATDAIGNERGQVYWEHNAAMLTSTDMDAVSDQARIIAFDSWPLNDGWSHHSASITEVTASFIREVWGLHQQKMLADNPLPESHRFVQFEPPEHHSH